MVSEGLGLVTRSLLTYQLAHEKEFFTKLVLIHYVYRLLMKSVISVFELPVKNFFHLLNFLVDGAGLEPAKPFRAADLQSAAIAAMRPIHKALVGQVGIEPTTSVL